MPANPQFPTSPLLLLTVVFFMNATPEDGGRVLYSMKTLIKFNIELLLFLRASAHDQGASKSL
jgi:hypothetical protein